MSRSHRVLALLVAATLTTLGGTACSNSPVSPPASASATTPTVSDAAPTVSEAAPTTQAAVPYQSYVAAPTYEVPAAVATTEALPTPDPVVSDTYTYKVTGKNRGSITYSNTGGNTSQVTSARLPWSTSVESPGFSGMTFAYVSAQNSGGGTISCQIVGPSGEVISENSSEGSYAIVTCQA